MGIYCSIFSSMHESVSLYFLENLIFRYLQDIPILIFINKIDTLEQRIRDGHRLNTLFEELEKELNSFPSVTQSSDGSFYKYESSRRASRDSLEDISRIFEAHPYNSFCPKGNCVLFPFQLDTYTLVL